MTTFFWITEYFVSFIECFMSFIFCESFIKNENSHVHKYYRFLLSVSIAFITIVLGNIELFSAINTVLLFIIIWLTQCFFHKINIIKAFCIIVSYYALIFIIDMSFSALVAAIKDMSISDIFSGFSTGRVVAALGSKSVLTITCTMIRKLSRKNKNINNKANIIFSLVSVVIIVISASMYFLQADTYESEINFVLMMFFIVMLMLILTLYISIGFFFDSQQKKQEYELIGQRSLVLEHSLTELEATFSMWRKSVHDYKNTVLAINSMVKEQKFNELSEYLDNEIKGFENSAGYIHTGNAAADTVINAKYIAAQNQNISFTVNAVMPKETIISDIHLAVIIGNLIDNAIEAEENEDDKHIHVQISAVKSFLIIKITNAFSKGELSEVSTKKNLKFHGIGLKSVRGIVKQYNGEFTLNLENKNVTATVMLPN